MTERNAASYRDPAGFIFQQDGILYRQVNKVYSEDYTRLMESGAYRQFVTQGWLLPHEELKENIGGFANWHLTLIPEKVSVISYSYEWSFEMLRDAALRSIAVWDNTERCKPIKHTVASGPAPVH